MISIERQRKNRPTYVELKSAVTMGEKDRYIQKLGGSLKASIDKLKRIRTDILSESDVKQLAVLLADYEKENIYYNQLQKSLAQIDEQSDLLDKIKKINKDFIESHKPQELQKKLDYMKGERSRHLYAQGATDIGQTNLSSPPGQVLFGDKHAVRNQILKKEQEELKEIEKLVTKIKKIATDTSLMILEQGMKLQIAAGSMSSARDKLKDGRQQLTEANTYQQDTNRKMMAFCCLTVLIVAVIVLILYSSRKSSSEK